MEKRGKQICRSAAGCLIALSFVLGGSFAAAQTAGKVREVRFPSQMPVGQFDTIGCQKFCDEAEARSNKTLRFKHYPAQQLYTAEQLQHILPAGGVEVAQIELYKFSGTVPEGMITTPSLLTYDEYFRWMYDTANGGGFYYKIMRPALAKKKIHLISSLNFDPHGGIMTVNPVRKVTDYKGMKIREGGKSMGALIVKYGAKAVVMSSADVYMALQRKTIDGVQSSPTSFVSRKWYEMTNHYQTFDSGNSGYFIAANMDFWKSLTPEQQTAIEEAARSVEIWSAEASVKEDDQCMETMKKAKIEFWNFTPEEMKDFRENALEELRKIVEPEVGAETWKEAIQLKKNIMQAKTTALEVLKNRKYVRP